MTFEMTQKRGLSNRGEMTGYRARRESLSFSLNNVSLGACLQWQVQKTGYRSQVQFRALLINN